MPPLVSILIPTYNGADHLQSGLESAQAQSHEDLEILVVDDASTDDSREVARGLAAGDERIQVHHNECRLGLAGNWNRCVDLARGEWIKFLFQDDLLHPRCVDRLLAAGTTDRPLVVGRRGLSVEAGVDDGTRRYFERLPTLETLFPDQDFVPPGFLCRALVRHLATNFIGEPTAVLLHRSVFERFGSFHPQMIQLADLELWARIGVHTGLGVVAEEVATFRVHTGSQSARNKDLQVYHKDLLDPLILYHQYAHDGAFAPLRQVAAAMQPPISFAKVTAVEAARARSIAEQAARKGDPSLLSAWQEVSGAHPRLRRSLRLSWQRLRRALGIGGLGGDGKAGGAGGPGGAGTGAGLSPEDRSPGGSPPGRPPPPPARPGPSCS